MHCESSQISTTLYTIPISENPSNLYNCKISAPSSSKNSNWPSLLNPMKESKTDAEIIRKEDLNSRKRMLINKAKLLSKRSYNQTITVTERPLSHKNRGELEICAHKIILDQSYKKPLTARNKSLIPFSYTFKQNYKLEDKLLEGKKIFNMHLIPKLKIKQINDNISNEERISLKDEEVSFHIKLSKSKDRNEYNDMTKLQKYSLSNNDIIHTYSIHYELSEYKKPIEMRTEISNEYNPKRAVPIVLTKKNNRFKGHIQTLSKIKYPLSYYKD